MIRVAFTLIGGKQWFGGYNYQLNLFNAISKHENNRIQMCLFLGDDIEHEFYDAFNKVANIEIIKSEIFNKNNVKKRQLNAVVLGVDNEASNMFEEHHIDVVFETADYYGWRFPIATVAWIPDFQHRHLKRLFGLFSYWKRDFGFRMQISTNRLVMLSSEDARADCERFYPQSKGRTHVVRFAVPYTETKQNNMEILKTYGLPKHFFFLPNQFWKHKNHLCVINALKLCKARGDEVVIVASGKQQDLRDVNYFPSILKLITLNNLEKNFKLIGLVPYAHIQALMQECAALINPSYFEGWSTTVEEAKSYNKNMILSAINVHKEQATGRAVFFNANKPKELAEILSDYKPQKTNNNNKQKEMASKTSLASVKQYAKEFADLIVLAGSERH